MWKGGYCIHGGRATRLFDFTWNFAYCDASNGYLTRWFMTQRVSLEVLQIADPCTSSWAEMQGDGRARFCGHCKKSVHDLSAMTRSEAERLVCESAGSLCVRFKRDELGSVVTLDYMPFVKSGWRRWWPLSMAATVAVAFAGLIFARPKASPPVVTMGLPAMTPCTKPTSGPTTQMLLGKISFEKADFAEVLPSTLPTK